MRTEGSKLQEQQTHSCSPLCSSLSRLYKRAQRGWQLLSSSVTITRAVLKSWNQAPLPCVQTLQPYSSVHYAVGIAENIPVSTVQLPFLLSPQWTAGTSFLAVFWRYTKQTKAPVLRMSQEPAALLQTQSLQALLLTAQEPCKWT